MPDPHHTTRLGELVDIVSGYSARGRIEADEDADYALLQTGDVDEYGGFDPNEIEPSVVVSKGGRDPLEPRDRHLLREGDVLYASLGGTLGGRRRAALVETDPGEIAASATFFIIRVADADQLDPGYLAWYLDQAHAVAYLDALSTGPGRVSKSALESLTISIPPVHTQRAIAQLARLAADERQLAEEQSELRWRLIHSQLLDLATGRVTTDFDS